MRAVINRIKTYLNRLMASARDIGQATAVYALILGIIVLAGAGAVYVLKDKVNTTADDASVRIKTTDIGSDKLFQNVTGLEDMTVVAYDYEGEYDGEYHTGSVVVQVPSEGYAIRYGTAYGSYTSATAPEYVNSGVHKVYFRVTADGYKTYDGIFTVRIATRYVPIPVVNTNYTYTGFEISAAIANYREEYCTMTGTTSATNAGTYTVTFSLKNPAYMRWSDNSTADKVFNWVIAKRNMRDVVIASIPEQSWTGEAITPEPGVTLGAYTLRKNVDFTYSYDNNVTSGVASVIVTAKPNGNFEGFKIQTFNITAGQMLVSVRGYSGVYDAKSHTGTVTVSKPTSGYTIYYGTSAGSCTSTSPIYRANAGTQTVYVKITADNYADYTGSFDIVITKAKIARIPSTDVEQYYTGNTVTPTWVDYDASKLTMGGDTSGVATGTYTTTFTPTANYCWSNGNSNTESVSWTIVKRSLSTGNIAAVGDRAWTGSAIKPTPTVTCNGRTLTAGTDFTFSYRNNIAVGTATITATATANGNYSGYIERTFNIVPATMSVTASGYSGTYDGSAHGGTVTVSKPTSGATVYYGSTAANCNSTTPITRVAAGSQTVYYKVTASNYTTVTGSYSISIAQRNLSSVTIASVGNQTWTGSAIKPTPAVTYGSLTLASGTDFTYSYSNNTNVGTATITIKAVAGSNYTGSKSITFSIVKANMTVTKTNYSGTYDASAHTGSVTVSKPTSGATIYYGTAANSCTQTSAPTYTDAGTYTVYYKVTASNYNDATGSFTVTINVRSITVPSVSGSYTYDGNTKTATITNKPSATYVTTSGTTSTANAGSYTVTFALKNTKSLKWSDNTTTNKSGSWSIAKAKIAVPTLTQSSFYTGSTTNITSYLSGYDSTKMTIGGTYSSATAGNYTATLTPKANYCWTDGTTGAKSYSWKIISNTGTQTFTMSHSGGCRNGTSCCTMTITYYITESYTYSTNSSTIKITKITCTYSHAATNSHCSCYNSVGSKLRLDRTNASGGWVGYTTLFDIPHQSSSWPGRMPFGGSTSCVFKYNGSNYASSAYTVNHNSSDGTARMELQATWSWGTDGTGTYVHDTNKGIDSNSIFHALYDTKP